ncbi:MAG: hypothetical protein KKH72_15170, partial [Alphaproteobacteria bacterium]|nr:hypothetical protein [Alphaproteobacteria bacterium]
SVRSQGPLTRRFASTSPPKGEVKEAPASIKTRNAPAHRAQSQAPVLRNSIRPSANRAGGTIGGERTMRPQRDGAAKRFNLNARRSRISGASTGAVLGFFPTGPSDQAYKRTLS